MECVRPLSLRKQFKIRPCMTIQYKGDKSWIMKKHTRYENKNTPVGT